MAPQPVPTGVPMGGVPLAGVVIGASAGGPQVVEAILRALPRYLSAPVLLCQHMPSGSTELWADRLDGLCELRVEIPREGQRIEEGHVYVAPAGKHLLVRGTSLEPHAHLGAGAGQELFVPSIDRLMLSAAHVWGSLTLGVLLSGLGDDGAQGMLAIRQAGGMTIAQAPGDALAPSMPRSAAELGAVAEVVPVAEIARTIVDRVAGRL
jgi:two-component system, chemotaxis family, protein-glutamate methylesterase/glutaminase